MGTITTIGVAGPDRLDELRELWLAMHHRHQQVATLQPLVADDEISWRRRRARYLGWLMAEDEAFLVIADSGPTPVGYAMVHLVRGPDDTLVGNVDAQRLYERRGFRPAETVLYRFGAT